jgi:hypothetical protein
MRIICEECLEREMARRYQSVAGLAEDVQRYLVDQPIQARPPSTTYQLRKLVARHKGPFAVAAGVFAILLLFSILASTQAVQIAKERDRANTEAEAASRVSEFLKGLFNSSNPWEATGYEVSTRQLLDAAAQQVDKELSDQPAIAAAALPRA